MKKPVKFVLWLAIGVLVVLFAGAMLNFYPFLADEQILPTTGALFPFTSILAFPDNTRKYPSA